MSFTDFASKSARQLTGLLIGLMLSASVSALDRDLGIGQFHHTSWTAKDGAPIGTRTMEQTPDGWLWLGGPSGLFRFDGMRFEPYQPLPGEEFHSTGVSRLYTASNGDLWIGLMSGGVSRLSNGHLTHFGREDGLDPSATPLPRADIDGAVWVATPTSLFRFDGGKWQRVGAEWNLDMKVFHGLVVDGRGTLWVMHSEGISFLRRGSKRFEPGGPADFDTVSTQFVDGVVWRVGRKSLRRFPDVNPDAPLMPSSTQRRRQSSALIDRDLNLWSVYCPAGLCRTRLPPTLVGDVVDLPAVDEAFTTSSGLSGDSGTTVLEDEEGSIWFASNAGLDRFRRGTLANVPMPRNALTFSLVPANANSVWVTAYAPHAPRLWALDRSAAPVESPDEWIRATARDSTGRLWLGGAEGFWQWSGANFIDVPRPPEALHQVVRSMASDRTGLWVAFTSGAFHLEDGVWASGRKWGLPEMPPSSLTVDRSNAAWFGYGDGKIVSLSAGSIRSFDSRDGVDLGSIVLMHASTTVYAAADSGVLMRIGERFHRLVAADPAALAGVSGIVETANGDLWLNGRKGAARIRASDLASFTTNPQHIVRPDVFDIHDGYPGIANLKYPQPSAVAGDDGRLWFAGIGGVAWLDPRRIEPHDRPASAALLELLAAGVTFPLTNGLELPQRTTSVQFRYTAPGMRIPERARFRYRLDGVDADWREPDSRRETGYTNLHPGDYRFHVIAANEEGTWGEREATIAFSIRPTAVQTVWFRSLCVLAALGGVFALYRLRVRQLTSHAREIMQERLIERERIARELHDTLLQGIHGLILRFQVATNRIAPDDPARASMESALERADQVLLDSRDRVANLREHTEHANPLHQALDEVGAELSRDYSSDFRMTIDGIPRELHPVAQEEVQSIASEALLNAFRHSKGPRIDLEIRYTHAELRVRVHDNGIGIGRELLQQGRPGHWGLSGMRERAQRIGAVLNVHSVPAEGTQVELRLGSRLAFKDDRPLEGWRRVLHRRFKLRLDR